MTAPLAIARDVITVEIAGLSALRDSLDARFTALTELFAAARGRIVVTGIGKSGHVARKISSTLASTGAPSLYLHPAEASHGDLGMVGREDAILALSKSGETVELRDLLSHAQRFSIPVGAITADPDSTLARAAAVAVILPPAPEACDETRAPTTSTTMMMALGDALAVALLRRKGFTAADFRGFHPGGSLGAALRRVEELMHGAHALPLAPVSASLADAVDALNAGGFGCVGFTDDAGRLVGVLTDGDLRRGFSRLSPQTPAREAMTRSPKAVARDAFAGDALAIMSRGKITSLFVVEEGRPVGLLHVHDLLSTGVL